MEESGEASVLAVDGMVVGSMVETMGNSLVLCWRMKGRMLNDEDVLNGVEKERC